MAKAKLEGPAKGTMQSVLGRMYSDFGIQMTTGEEFSKTWRYLTFSDPKTGLPSIAHEWIVGAAGFRAGTVNQLRGLAATGKSSLCMLEYASAVRNGGAFCAHLETEGGGMANSRIAEFGMDPRLLAVPDSVDSLEEAIKFVDTFRCLIRGGDGGSVNELGRKSATKFKVEDAEDPKCEKPIIIGIDSLSDLGKDDDVNTDVADMGKAKQPGWFPKQIKAWFRDRKKKYEKQLVTLFLTSQETTKIGTGSLYTAPEKTSVAGDAIKFEATVALEMTIKDWKDKSGVKVGREIMLRCFKSKLGCNYGRRVSFFMTDHDGFDFIHADAEFLLGKDSPFKDGGAFPGTRLCYRHSQGITCRPLGDRAFKTEEEFIRAFYANREVVDQCRDWMFTYGYGLPHETRYHDSFDEEGRWIGGDSVKPPTSDPEEEEAPADTEEPEDPVDLPDE